MRRLRWLLPFVLASQAGAAWAQTAPASDPPPPQGPQYTLTATVGGPYTFEDNSILPDFEPGDIEGTIAFEVKHNPWTFTYRHSETDDGDSERVEVQFKESDCPLLSIIGCTARVRWNDASSETVTYRAAVFEEMAPWHGITPTLTFALDAITGDRETVVASPELRLKAKPFADELPNFSVRATVGASYSDDTNDTEPTWGIELEYAFENNLTLSAGYTSRVTFDDVTEEFGDVQRSATLTLKYAFGPGVN